MSIVCTYISSNPENDLKATQWVICGIFSHSDSLEVTTTMCPMPMALSA